MPQVDALPGEREVQADRFPISEKPRPSAKVYIFQSVASDTCSNLNIVKGQASVSQNISN